jgi:hypothetical protein
MTTIRWAESFSLLCALTMSATLAQSQSLTATPPPGSAPPTYKALLDQGFEIKSVLLLSAETSTRMAQAIEQDSVLVTMQKSAASATCWITLAAWNQHNVSSVPCTLLQ